MKRVDEPDATAPESSNERASGALPSRAEASLKHQKSRVMPSPTLDDAERWRTAFIHSLPAPTYVVNREGVFVDVNEHCARHVFGRRIEEVVGRSLRDVFPEALAEELWQNDLEVLEAGTVRRFEEVVPHADDNALHAYLSTKFPIRSSDSEIIAVGGVSFEITERKMAELKTESLLFEKSLLLKELRHRVRNNLQLISSLLRLQSNKTTNPEALTAFAAVRSRIEAIASLYETLQPSRIENRISIRGYVGALLDNLRRMQADPSRIELITSIDDTQLHIDDASPLGLVVNELASNAMEHAFPGDARGEVSVEICATEAGRLRLTVRDNGIGLEDPAHLRNCDSLGFQLVRSLVEFQLKGSVEAKAENGTEITVEFEPRQSQANDM